APTATPATATPAPISPGSSAAIAPSCVDGRWSCPQQERFAEVTAYAKRTVGAHGYLSVVFTDRVTGATWRTGDTTHPGWTASTVKLAIAADLLRRDRAHQITLSAADRHDLATMLNFSDNAATDRLWKAYGDDAMLARFRADFGMTGLRFIPGFTPRTYWGFVKCTADDLAALMRYVLASPDRDYLVAAMRGVAPNQQWGVWAAGAAQQPGNKDGWSFESDPYGKHWVTDTVGFAGPAQRYTLAIMYQVGPAGSLADGVHAVSDVAALLFGAPVPARITVPAPDG
ncbi:MAG TPA: tat pathway signal sequence, partial [Pseudonocardia sp.]|nr:tat pathway signal sequence [Pseudonocardia sp.]